jgi:hypothetical protein
MADVYVHLIYHADIRVQPKADREFYRFDKVRTAGVLGGLKTTYLMSLSVKIF